MKEQVIEKLDKYHLTETEVEPQNPATTRKYGKQNLITDTGIESRIPPDQVIDAMKEVGDQMNSSLKETGLGGLAGTPFGKEVAENFLGK